jgi:hypothetical protein
VSEWDAFPQAGDLSGVSTPPGVPRFTVTPRRDEAGAPPLDDMSHDLLVRTVLGEAAAEPHEGKAAVAAVIRNRLNSGKFGATPADVVLAKNQFEPWSTPQGRGRMMSYAKDSPEYGDASAAVDRVFGEEGFDPTEGATHFYAPKAQAALGRQAPSWAQGEPTVIGRHNFYRLGDNSPGSTDFSAQSKTAGDPWAAFPAAPDGGDAPFKDRFSAVGAAAPTQNAEALGTGLRAAADRELASGDAGGQTKTFIENAVNTALLNIPRNVEAFSKSRDSGRPFAEEYQKLKDVEEAGSRLNPKSSIAGTATGIVGGALALPGIGGGATTAARAGRAALTAAGYSGASEALDSKDPYHTAVATALGGALGGVAAPVAEKIIGFVASKVRAGKTADVFLKPDGTLTDEAAAQARAAGIDPATFGQVLHRKFAESFAEKGAGPATAREAAAGEFNIPLSKGQSTADLDAIRFEDMSGRGAYGKPAQDEASRFFTGQKDAIREGGEGIGNSLAGGRATVETPNDAGRIINSEVGGTAVRARNIVAQAEGAAEREASAQRGMVEDSGRTLDDITSGGRAPLSRPQEAGEVVGEAVRGEAARGRAAYRGAYDDALSREGEFSDIAFHDIGERIRREALKGDNPVVISDRTTPVAAAAIQHLDANIGRLRIQDRAEPRSMGARTAGEVRFPGEPQRVAGAPSDPGAVIGVNMRGVEQARKELVSFYKSARSSGNAEDMRATRHIIEGFDNELETAIATGLFKGDETALPALRQARDLFSQYQRTFRPQGQGDDVGTAMRRIVERNATPEEIANMLYGSSRTGSTGLSTRLADRLETTLGRDSDAWNAVRQAAWMRVSQPRNAAGDVDAAKAAANIMDFTSGSGESLARALFSREELAAMRSHAEGVRALERNIAQAPATQRAEAARSLYQDVFGGDNIGGTQQAVFRRIVSGDATPEETAGAVFNAIGGNPGHAVRAINAIERITGRDSDTMAAVRQGVWQKLTQAAEGKDQPGAQKISQAIQEFVNGKGRTIAERLYTPEEIGLMRRYAAAVKSTVIPPGARTNSDTAPAIAAMLNKYGGAISSMLGVAADGATGGLAGYAVSSLLKKGLGSAKDARNGAKAAGSFSGAPTEAPQPPNVASKVGVAAGLEGPALHGLRQASDGNHYLPDPSRPGKYLMLRN